MFPKEPYRPHTLSNRFNLGDSAKRKLSIRLFYFQIYLSGIQDFNQNHGYRFLPQQVQNMLGFVPKSYTA